MPRPIIIILLIIVALSLIPMGLLYKARHEGKSRPRLQIVHDMDQQFYFRAQAENPFFADGRASRQHPAGTVARGRLDEDDAYFRGTTGPDTVYVEDFPLEITREVVMRGRDRYEIHCAPCHGSAGNGDGLVHRRAAALAEGTWTPPSDLTSETVVGRPVGHIYNSINLGIRNMPAYGTQISPADRWAVTAWVRVLQLSRNATIDDVTAEAKARLGNAAVRSAE
ncbi:MAG: cytochrome c [bacterium]|nr:cytochrome c [bacterium]